MTPARWPREPTAERLLVLDLDRSVSCERAIEDLPRLLDPGDLLVVNDSATLPASLSGVSEQARRLEVRFTGRRTAQTFEVVLFGDGDWRTPTEVRPPAPHLELGSHILFGDGPHGALRARVTEHSPISPRLLHLQFEGSGASLWQALYRQGRAVQYAYMRDALELWHVQTPYASRPWSVEMPSAGRPLSVSTLSALRRRGVELAWLTHAAGLSTTGDPALDRQLPLPERYELPARTVALVEQTRSRGGRVVAVGTSVVRALEGSYEHHGRLLAGAGETSLRIGADFEPRVVTGLLSGMHSPGESHYDLLEAFVDPGLLAAAHRHAQSLGLRDHEFGDKMLIDRKGRARRRAEAA